MTIQYSDPYKDNKFGKLKGDKRDTYFQIAFAEAKFYKHENSYVLAGWFTVFSGVDRAYGNAPIEPTLCELPIYGSEYEIRQKKPGTGGNGGKAEYETITLQPSIAEKLLYQHIEDNPTAFLDGNQAIKGGITFYPDAHYILMDEDKRIHNLTEACLDLEQIESSGKYPDWIPPKSYSKSSWGNNKISLEEKETFLKGVLAQACKSSEIQQNKNLPLHGYVEILLNDYDDDERFLVTFFDLAKALIS